MFGAAVSPSESEPRPVGEQYVARRWWRAAGRWRLGLWLTGVACFAVGNRVSASGGVGATLEVAGGLFIAASLPVWSWPWGQSGRRERYFKLKSKWVEASRAHSGVQPSEESLLADLEPPDAFSADHHELLRISRESQLERVDQSIRLSERYARGVESRAAIDRILGSLERRAETPGEVSYVAALRDRIAARADAWRARNALLEASMTGFADRFAATKSPRGHETEFAALLAAQRAELQAMHALRIAAEGGDREAARQACEAWLTATDSVAAREKALYGAPYPRVAQTRE